MVGVILMAKIPGKKCLLDPRAKEQNLPPTTHFQDSALGEASLGVFTCPSVSEPFPFGFFATNLNFGEERPGPPQAGSHQAAEEAFLHKIFLWVAFAFIFWLLIA